MILAMENAGQLIEDEELRAQIKGSGIGTSATRAEILKKLIHIKYLALNKKTQIITPTLQGEMVFDEVENSIKSLLNPELTASWEKGLTYVAEGDITPEEYMRKLDHFIISRTNGVKGLNNQYQLRACYDPALLLLLFIALASFCSACSVFIKSDKKLVVVKTPDGMIETGMKKFGAMLGDEVEVGCGSVLNPGTVVGSHSNIYPLSSVRGYIPGGSIYKKQGEVVEKREETV